MKKIAMIFCLCCAMNARAQSDEIQQLTLDLQKLAQMRSILKDMQQGYEIISKGYNAVSDIAKGNFNLHEIFIDGLLAVSPTVRNYYKVAEVVSNQSSIVKEYKAAYNRFVSSGHFNTDELNYLNKVYSNLFNASMKNLDALLMVVTTSDLRMDDAERLKAIDKIHTDTKDQLNFLRRFNNSTNLLALAKTKEVNDAKTMSGLYGITH